jgi:YVTN family beta-propeller protein
VYAAVRAPRALLPTGWSISPPSGAVAATGTMPQGLALSPDGQSVAVVESGDGPPGVRIFDAATLHEKSFIPLKGAFGDPVWDGNGFLWVALANVHALGRIDVAKASLERSIDTGDGTWPGSLALSPDAKMLAFSDDATAHIGMVDIASATVAQLIPTDKHPGPILYSPDGTMLAAVNRGARTITLVNAATSQAQTMDVGNHPSALAFAPDGKRIYVSLADEDTLAVVDVATAKVTNRIGLELNSAPGTSPNSIALARDGTVFVSCGAINAFAVISGDRRTGFIPAGWYPDGIAVDRAAQYAYVINGKGERSRANPNFNPFLGHMAGFVATSLTGSLRKIDLRAGVATAQVVANIEKADGIPAGTPLRKNGPLKHVIYVIKENRSYDQVLSDLAGGDGDAKLLIFGAQITPNQHAFARRFGLFDRAFANAQVSADGHNWTDGAFANDYLERFWPVVYGNRRQLYDFEGTADASVPRSGFLWDSAARANITYRNYGEFVTNPSSTGSEVTVQQAHLVGHTSATFPGFDMAFSDLQRYAIWLREFRDYQAAGNLPALEIVRLPNDHTSGTKPGALTPEAYVAQNDYAAGQIVDAVSHSRFWRSTAIFFVEDDAQNGPDHVDDQRTTYYIASPYARGGVDHTRYSTASVVRTIELILGLRPLSIYDAHAQPMYRAFTTKANFTSFTAQTPLIDITAVNKKTAFGAARSARMNFRDADANDPAALNEILYRDFQARRAHACTRSC